MDIKTFEHKLALNTGALSQVKRLVKQLKPRETDINISTEFTIVFRLSFGGERFSRKSLNIDVETWGINKRITIEGYGDRQARPVYMALTKANINKIYVTGMKVYKEMI